MNGWRLENVFEDHNLKTLTVSVGLSQEKHDDTDISFFSVLSALLIMTAGRILGLQSCITAPGHVVLRLKLRESCGSTTTLPTELLHP